MKVRISNLYFYSLKGNKVGLQAKYFKISKKAPIT